jgi:hypothetical protein
VVRDHKVEYFVAEYNTNFTHAPRPGTLSMLRPADQNSDALLRFYYASVFLVWFTLRQHGQRNWAGATMDSRGKNPPSLIQRVRFLCVASRTRVNYFSLVAMT